ncbi:hypothetical protein ACTHTN_15265, partial [Neisseria sp. P0015.S006]
DLNLQDFISRVNSDLVGKYVNIAARASGFIAKRFESRLKDVSGSALLAKLAAESDTIAEQYENREYARALRDIMALADAVNEYVDANKPWELNKFLESPKYKWRFTKKDNAKLANLPDLNSDLNDELFTKPVIIKNDLADLNKFINSLPKNKKDIFQKEKETFSLENYEKVKESILRYSQKEGRKILEDYNNAPNHSPYPLSLEEIQSEDLATTIADLWINIKVLDTYHILDDLLHEVCSELINAFTMLTAYLAPVLPQTAANAARFLNLDAITWANTRETLGEHAINKYEHLMQRVEQKQVDDLIEANKQSIQTTPAPAAEESKYEKVAEQASFDDFMKIDMRVAKVLNCEAVEGSTKLLKFDLDFGFEKRIIFSGIAASYPNPAELNGRMVIAVANFAPRKMAKFGVS